MTMTRQQKRAEYRTLAKQINKMKKLGLIEPRKKSFIQKIKSFFKGKRGDILRPQSGN